MKPLRCSLLWLDCFIYNLALDELRLVVTILLESIHRAVEVVIELHLVPCHERHVDTLRYAVNDLHVLEEFSSLFVKLIYTQDSDTRLAKDL